MIQKTLRALLPEYTNHTLSPLKRWIVAAWLKGDTAARLELQTLHHLRAAIQAQPIVAPSADVWDRIQAGVRTPTALSTPVRARGGFWQTWAVGMAMVVLSLVLLWKVLPPSVILQWSAQGGEPATFRIYRAVSGQTEAFELLKEIAPQDNITSLNARVYTYRDFLLLPGQQYIYRVEVIDQNGFSTSQTIIGDSTGALPGQVALLLSLVIVIYGLRLAVQKPGLLPLRVV